MQNVLVNVNGEISEAAQAKIPVFDRGFLYGDSLYEVARSYHGIFLHLEEHLKRMEQSAKLCRMVLAQSLELYQREILRTFKAFRALPGHGEGEAYCRIIVTRGVGKIGFGLSCLETPTQFVIIVQPVDAPTSKQMLQGLHLEVSGRLRNDRRALDPAMKSGNYLNSLLAYLDAAADGYDDALLCNSDGHVTEGTTFNIFYVKNRMIITPPLDVGILDGITRRHVITLARGAGFAVREVRFPRERLYEADEVFLTSSIKEVFPVTRIDKRLIGNGKPGPVTQQLHDVYQTTLPIPAGFKKSPLQNEKHAS